MVDKGMIQGSAKWAVPVIVSGDKVYVHTDIQKLSVNSKGRPTDNLYRYHEVQYDIKEYIEIIGTENNDLRLQLEQMQNKLSESQNELTNTQLALCEIYESIGG